MQVIQALAPGPVTPLVKFSLKKCIFSQSDILVLFEIISAGFTSAISQQGTYEASLPQATMYTSSW